MASPLGAVPTEDLKKELQNRYNIEYDKLAQQREATNSLVVKHIDALLELTPKHSRSSCSDENNFNEERDCTRCALIEFRDMKYMGTKFQLEITVRSNPIAGKTLQVREGT